MTLKEIREKKKLSIQEVADRVGVTLQCLYNWENGKREPNDKMKFELAKALNVKPTTIFLAVNSTRC